MSDGAADGRRLTLRLAADDPLFRDHFPGTPVLPAIGQLELLRRACERFDGAGFIAALDGVRFSRPVTPAAPLEVEVSAPDEDGRSTFAVRCGGQVASLGALVWSRDA